MRALLLLALVAVAARAEEAAPLARPSMRQLTTTDLPKPPSRRELVDARAELKARFRKPLAQADSAAGATLAGELLYAAAVDETDRSLKWLMLDESRRLAVNAGRPEAVSRAITLASAVYDFDALELELKSLGEIPLRALDPGRAVLLAQAAEKIATRADIDGRPDLAENAWLLAFRTWQRTGNLEAARRVESHLK